MRGCSFAVGLVLLAGSSLLEAGYPHKGRNHDYYGYDSGYGKRKECNDKPSYGQRENYGEGSYDRHQGYGKSYYGYDQPTQGAYYGYDQPDKSDYGSDYELPKKEYKLKVKDAYEEHYPTNYYGSNNYNNVYLSDVILPLPKHLRKKLIKAPTYPASSEYKKNDEYQSKENYGQEGYTNEYPSDKHYGSEEGNSVSVEGHYDEEEGHYYQGKGLQHSQEKQKKFDNKGNPLPIQNVQPPALPVVIVDNSVPASPIDSTPISAPTQPKDPQPIQQSPPNPLESSKPLPPPINNIQPDQPNEPKTPSLPKNQPSSPLIEPIEELASKEQSQTVGKPVNEVAPLAVNKEEKPIQPIEESKPEQPLDPKKESPKSDEQSRPSNVKSKDLLNTNELDVNLVNNEQQQQQQPAPLPSNEQPTIDQNDVPREQKVVGPPGSNPDLASLNNEPIDVVPQDLQPIDAQNPQSRGTTANQPPRENQALVQSQAQTSEGNAVNPDLDLISQEPIDSQQTPVHCEQKMVINKCSPFFNCLQASGLVSVASCWAEGPLHVFDEASQSCKPLDTIQDQVCSQESACAGKSEEGWVQLGGQCTRQAFFCGQEMTDNQCEGSTVTNPEQPDTCVAQDKVEACQELLAKTVPIQ